MKSPGYIGIPHKELDDDYLVRANGYVSPNGVFWRCESFGHSHLEDYILSKILPDARKKRWVYLDELNWLKIQSYLCDSSLMAYTHWVSKVSSSQWDFVERYFRVNGRMDLYDECLRQASGEPKVANG